MQQWPIPPHFQVERINTVFRVPYQKLAAQAEAWAKTHKIPSAKQDKTRNVLLLVDCQNTFCLPDFELFVAGRSGIGAVEDNVKLSEFIYRNLGHITHIVATMDTHVAMQIFHPMFWINHKGEHPPLFTVINVDDVKKKKWCVNPDILTAKQDLSYMKQYALYYVKTLREKAQYDLTIWPYHAMMGGISHALVSSIEEACFFHTVARKQQTQYELKGRNPMTEHYSVFSPEVTVDHENALVEKKNKTLINDLLQYDRIIIAGQAKSHCVAWSIETLLDEIKKRDASLANKVYLLEDCTSSVVIPGVVDFTDTANEHFARFEQAGMHRVLSTVNMHDWPGS